MSNQAPKMLAQNLRRFTVQIRNAKNEIVGTGFVVSTTGEIVTCAHVVRTAGVDPRSAGNKLVYVCFPEAADEAARLQSAKVVAYFPQHDDDVVILQLLGDVASLPIDQVASLGKAEESIDHPFRSYGFRPLPPYSGGLAAGVIQGDIPPPTGKALQVDPVQLRSTQIDAGMSGAAVLDTKRNLVVGIVSQTYHSDPKTLKDHDTAWAINARVLSLDPLNLPVQDLSLPLGAGLQLKFSREEIAAIRAAVIPNPGIQLSGAPPSLSEWVGRSDLLKTLSSDWVNPQLRVTGLMGFGGEGKSSLARRWIDISSEDISQPQPNGVFWWNFNEKPSVDIFFEEAFAYLRGGREQKEDSNKANNDRVDRLCKEEPAQVLGAMLGVQRYLFVLDGLEVLQHQRGDQYGLLKDKQLRKFLEYFASLKHQSFCLITSRAPMLDLIACTTYTPRDVNHLSRIDGQALLRRIGVSGAEAALDKVVADWDGYALALSLLGAYLVKLHGGDVAYADELTVLAENDLRYERVYRILRCYDEHLTEAERAFLMLFSALRLPVNDTTFQHVFRTQTNTLDTTISRLDDAAFSTLIKHLLDYQILRYDEQADCYTAHVLIRTHYLKLLNNTLPSVEISAIHKNIAKYYRSIAGLSPEGRVGTILLSKSIKGMIATRHPVLAGLGILALGAVALMKYLEDPRHEEAEYHSRLAGGQGLLLQEEQYHLRLTEGQDQDMLLLE
ncbi:MAG: hypothetical protein NVS4B7_20310 [Ktedonobacteraceae bacterium]